MNGLTSSPKLLTTVLLFVLLAVGSGFAKNLNAPRESTVPRSEVRALWVDGFNPGIRTREEAEQLVTNAKKAAFNTLIVQVRRRADALYSNSSEPGIEDFPIEPGFDPLQNIVDVAHREGIEVHAWINAMTVWKNQAPPKSSNHIFNLHGPTQTGRDNWLTADAGGKTLFPVGYFLDPGHPDAMEYLVRIYTNIVQKYAVDGIHFDYIRYPETETDPTVHGSGVGYNPVSLERFRRATGREDTPAPDDPQFIEWRQQQVTNLVRRVYLEAKAINPRVKVSAATIAWGKPPVKEQDYPESAPMQRAFQNWNSWMKLGFLDMAVPMNYDRESDPRTRDYFTGWIRWEKQHKYGQQLVIGVGSYLNSADETLAQVNRVREPAGKDTADGISFYSYSSFMRSDSTAKVTRLSFDRLHTGPEASFAAPAVVPNPGLDHGTHGWLAGTARDKDGKGWDGAEVEVQRSGWRPFRHKDKVFTDGNGFFGMSRLRPGRYEVRLVAARSTRSVIEVLPGKVAQVALSAK